MCRVEAIHQRMEIQVDVVRRKGRLGRRRGKPSTEWQLWLLDPLRVKLGPVYLTSTGPSEKCQPSCLNLASLSSRRDRVTVHVDVRVRRVRIRYTCLHHDQKLPNNLSKYHELLFKLSN